MVKEDRNSEIIEHGDIFFFYRPKVDSTEVKELEDVQRFYMVTSPERRKTTKQDVYRLFLLGQKQLPEIVEGKSTSKERNWALNILTTSNIEEMHNEPLPAEYTTKTRGERRIGAAAPAGEKQKVHRIIHIEDLRLLPMLLMVISSIRTHVVTLVSLDQAMCSG